MRERWIGLAGNPGGQAMQEEEMLAEDFINQPTYRGMRVNGQQVATLVIQGWVVRGQQAWMRSGSNDQRNPCVGSKFVWWRP